MPLEINASKIVNTVGFKVDNEALKQAKLAIKSVKDYAEGLQPSLNMAKFKTQMREMEAYARRLQQTTNGVGVVPPMVKPKPSRGGGGMPIPSGGSDNDAAKRRQERRQDLGSLRQENFEYRAGRFNRVNAEDLNTARMRVEQTVTAFQNEEISLARLNQLLSHQLDILRNIQKTENSTIEDSVRLRRREKTEQIREANRRIKQRDTEAKEQKRAIEREQELQRREKERRLDRTREGLMGLNPRMLAGGLIGAAAYEGVSRVRETLSSSAERINLAAQGARNVQANPNALLAMQYWGQQNGVDSANIKKAIDNVKDVRERLGNTELNSTLNPKNGKWTGGDQGVNNIMDTFGWNKEQIAKFQNNPLDFIGAVVNEGQRRGMNSAQIGRLMENLGDDLMHYERMFENSGQGFDDTIKMMQATGAALSDEQIDAAHNYTMLAAQLSMISDGLGANFLTGFMAAMGKGDDFTKNVQALDDGAKWLGAEVGDLALQFSNLITSVKETRDGFVNWWNGVHSPETTAAAANALSPNTPIYTDPNDPTNHIDPNAVDNANASWDSIMSFFDRIGNSHMTMTGLVQNEPDSMFSNVMNGTSGNGVGYQNPNMTVQVAPQITLIVQPDSGDLGLQLKAQLDDAIEDYSRQTTLNTMSSTSVYGF